MSGKLGASLEAALVRELRATWRQLNDTYFKSALAAPTLELVASRATLGRWVPDTRTIEMSRPLVVEQPWGAVVEVLKHEMAHQYVQEVLGETAETAHGRGFREACARLGIDARASGVPGGGSDKVVERIARLLALAESPNRHEAEAAMAAAHKLMLRHNVDATTVRSPAASSYGFRHLGKPSGRIDEHARLVAMVLGKYFFVEAIWIPVWRPIEGKRGSVLEVCGTGDNIAIAEYVHGFLHQTAERLWRDHKRERRIDSDRDRRTYLAGVMAGFADTLARSSQAQSASEGLVWVKDAILARYFGRRHPHVRHVRHAGQRRTDAWAHGRTAGRGIVLHKPVEHAPMSKGRLLPPKSS